LALAKENSKEGSSFLKKRSKKLCSFGFEARGRQSPRTKLIKVFLLLFLQKKKTLAGSLPIAALMGIRTL
jgi:hypothetical protein